MIVDSSVYFREAEMAEIRINELKDVVDKFIFISSTTTYRGDPNPNLLPEHLYDLADIEFHRYDIPSNLGSWPGEYWLRDNLHDLVRPYGPKDILILSDADEIPSSQFVSQIDSNCNLEMDQYYYNFNTYMRKQNGAFAVRIKDFQQNEILHMRNSSIFPLLPAAGWEFSFFGNTEWIQQKLKSYSHAEIDIPEYNSLEKIQYRIDHGIDIIDRPKVGEPVLPLPEYVHGRFPQFWKDT